VTSKKRLILWLYVLLACGVIRCVFYIQHINSPLVLETDYIFDVTPGTTFNRVVTRLASDGVIEFPFDAKLYGRLTGNANRILVGDYALRPGTSLRELLDKLVTGDVIIHQVVLVEGWTLAQALAAIQDNDMVSTTLDPDNPDELMTLLETETYPEGVIFPDTYNFSRGTTDREILLRARTLMDEILNEEWSTRDVGLPYDSPYEALIMASIIEKETALGSEREQIAGVFVRRLQRGMRLQTDPTVIYGLGADFNGDLTRANLRQASDYNTYMNAGLPPTPIALPGRESIAASLHPDQSDTLYFVARGDGSHYFSSTLEEHEQAVEQYQLGNGQ